MQYQQCQEAEADGTAQSALSEESIDHTDNSLAQQSAKDEAGKTFIVLSLVSQFVSNYVHGPMDARIVLLWVFVSPLLLKSFQSVVGTQTRRSDSVCARDPQC